MLDLNLHFDTGGAGDEAIANQDFGNEINLIIRETVRQAPVETRFLMAYGAKTGKVYKRGRGANFSFSHRASASGEAPAVDTGTGLRSLKSRMVTDSAGEVEMRGYLEFLDDRRNRIFIEPSIDMALNKATGAR